MSSRCGEQVAELGPIVKKLVDELRRAHQRTPVTIASWVHVRNAYFLALSLERLLNDQPVVVAQKQNTGHETLDKDDSIEHCFEEKKR